MNIAVYGRQFNDTVLPYIQQVFDALAQHEATVYIHQQLKAFLEGRINTQNCLILQQGQPMIGLVDVVITLGGDGTLLDMVTLIRDSGIPVIVLDRKVLGDKSVNMSPRKTAAGLDKPVNEELKKPAQPKFGAAKDRTTSRRSSLKPFRPSTRSPRPRPPMVALHSRNTQMSITSSHDGVATRVQSCSKSVGRNFSKNLRMQIRSILVKSPSSTTR